MTRMARPGDLPPYTQRRLGPERAAQAQALRERLAAAGGAWLAWPDWIDARPGRLQVVIGDCAADPPLSRTAAALAERHGDALLRGLGALALAGGAPRMALAVRADDERLCQALRPLLLATQVELHRVPPVWPSQPDADVPGAWGRSWVLPAPLLERVDAALTGRRPRRLCTVAGEVLQPQVLELSEGDTPEDLVRRCGGARTPAWVAVAAGAQPGRIRDRDLPLALSDDEGETVLLCLPQDHEVVRRLRRPLLEELGRARAVCPGCRLCSDACPQALRGAPLRPHLIGSEQVPAGEARDWAAACTGCGACDAVCPRGVSPARLVSGLALGLAPRDPAGGSPVQLLPGPGGPPREVLERRLPLQMVMTRMGLAGYAAP